MLMCKPLSTASIGVVLALSVCGSCGHESRADTKASPSSAPTDAEVTRIVSGSRLKSYGTIDELAKESELIVIGSVDTAAQVVERVDDVPFSVFRFNVGDVIKGATFVKGSSVRVRVLGGPGVSVDGQVGLVAGRRYLMFLQAFVMNDGVATGQYVIVGGSAGLYAVGSTGTFVKTSKDDPGLPTSVDLSTVQTQARAN